MTNIDKIATRLGLGYSRAIYGTFEAIHKQMDNDIAELLLAVKKLGECKKTVIPKLKTHDLLIIRSGEVINSIEKCKCGKCMKIKARRDSIYKMRWLDRKTNWIG